MKERIGTTAFNRHGSLMEVVEYNEYSDITVQFNNGYSVHTNWKAFEMGKVANPFDKTLFGTGYFGEGEYQSFKNGEFTPQYIAWQAMMNRCYNSTLERYEGCSVAEEWHNFQNFAKWYDANYYEIQEERMELDKDILIKGNKLYSPETCVYVPRFINCLFTKSDKIRGELPIGVSREKKTGMYRSRCNNGKKETIYLGLFKSPEDAFKAYKNYKEKIIKKIAEEYKRVIPKKLFDAMTTYIVEITD